MKHWLEGKTAQSLAQDYGTPLYVYSASTIDAKVRQLKNALQGTTLYYSLKANPFKPIAALLHDLGCNIEVASLGELKIAIEAGHSPADLLFIGPGKTRQEINEAVRLGVQRFVVDSYQELDTLAAETSLRSIYLRVNPSFRAAGGKLTMSGGQPKQFGIDREMVPHFIAEARKLHMNVTGLHYYLGTRFLKACDIIENSRQILEDASEIATNCNLDMQFLDFGGGFGIPYFSNETELSVVQLSRGLREVIKDASDRFPNAELCFESGRFITAEAGTLLLSVVSAKRSYGVQYLICDGGTNLNMAAIGTGSIGKRNFPSRLVPKQGIITDNVDIIETNVTGPLCTPDDLLLKSLQWPKRANNGDLVLIERVGAYGPTASPYSFLGHAYPTEILI